MDPTSWWVESYMCRVGPYLDGGSPYWPSPLGGVVLFLLRGAGMASDRTEVTVIPSVLARSKWHAYPCQNRHAWLCSTSPRSSQGSGQWRGRASLVRCAAESDEGVVAGPALALGLVFLNQLDLGRSCSCWLMYRGSLVLLTNRCLETPRGYNPNSSPQAFL